MPAAQAEKPNGQGHQAQGQPKGSGQHTHGTTIVVTVMASYAENQQQKNHHTDAKRPFQPYSHIHLSAPPLSLSAIIIALCIAIVKGKNKRPRKIPGLM
jgi:hypothetical protein